MNLTIENILIGITIMSVVFNVYQYFKVPQEDLEKRQEVSEKEVDGKAELLRQRVETDKKEVERRFVEVTDLVVNLRDNHIHTLQDNLDKFIEVQHKRNEEFSNSFVKIFTLLEERLPRK